MGFFNLYKPRKWDHQYIYYDPKKEAQKEREKRLAEGDKIFDTKFKTSIQRGSFRKQLEQTKNTRHLQTRYTNLRVVVILSILLALLYFLLK